MNEKQYHMVGYNNQIVFHGVVTIPCLSFIALILKMVYHASISLKSLERWIESVYNTANSICLYIVQ